MTIEVTILISCVSLAFAIYQGLTNMKRNQKADDKSEASQLTTVIVKLENIGTGITRIENEINNIKSDVKEDHERLIRTEESAKRANERMDLCEQHCKRFAGEPI